MGGCGSKLHLSKRPGTHRKRRSNQYTSAYGIQEEEPNDAIVGNVHERRSVHRPSNGNLLALQGKHDGAVLSLCNVGETLREVFCSGGEDGNVILHNWETGDVVRKFQAHKKAVNKLAFSTGHGVLVTGSRDGTARFWRPFSSQLQNNSDHPTPLFEAKHDLTVSAVDITANSFRAVTGSRDTTVKVWDCHNGSEIISYSKPRNIVTCIKWFPSVARLRTSQSNMQPFQQAGEDEVLEPHDIVDLGSAIFAQGSEDLCVRIWDTRLSQRTEALTLEGYVYFPLSIDISSDGTRLITSSKGFDQNGCEATIWDIRYTAEPLNRTETSRVYRVPSRPEANLSAQAPTVSTIPEDEPNSNDNSSGVILTSQMSNDRIPPTWRLPSATLATPARFRRDFVTTTSTAGPISPSNSQSVEGTDFTSIDDVIPSRVELRQLTTMSTDIGPTPRVPADENELEHTNCEDGMDTNENEHAFGPRAQLMRLPSALAPDEWTTKRLHQCYGHEQDATGCCFLPPDGSHDFLFATVSKDSSIRIWDATTGTCVGNQIQTGYLGFSALSSLYGRVDEQQHDVAVVRPGSSQRHDVNHSQRGTNLTSGGADIVAGTYSGDVFVFSINRAQDRQRVISIHAKTE